MKNLIILNKKEGETPLRALEKFREKNPRYARAPMTYAGRLDPMASGVLLILAWDEVKNKDQYLSKDKEYDFQILFGFSTDTYDILGKVTKVRKKEVGARELKKEINKHLKSFLGESKQRYPMYSSKTVKGKPLFSYARRGERVEIPERNILIKKLKLEKIKKIDNKKLFKNIEGRIKKVEGDFRQKEILKIWKEKLLDKDRGNLLLANLKIRCSTGTYVRSIANSLGVLIKIPALAFSIKRTKIVLK